MLNTLLRRLTPFATGRYILILVAVFLLIEFTAVAPYETLAAKSGGIGTLDMNSGYSADQAYASLTGMGADGRAQYLTLELTVDLLFPFVSGVLFCLASIYLFRRAFPLDHWVQYLPLIPLLVMAADYLENVCVVILLLAFPARLDGLVNVTSVLGAVKFGLSPVELLLLVGGLVGWLMVRIRKPQRAA